MRVQPPALERVLRRVDRNAASRCWVVAGSNNRGYAVVRVGDNNKYAHRVVYEWLVGPVGQGLQIDHLCRVKRCVNPEHLEPVTAAENKRRERSLVTACPSGHPYDDTNTGVYGGRRHCRACGRRRMRLRREQTRPATSPQQQEM